MSGIGDRTLPWRAMAEVIACSLPLGSLLAARRPNRVSQRFCRPQCLHRPRLCRRPNRDGRTRTQRVSGRAQLERLARDQGPLKSNWVPPGKSERYGHAEAMIAAPSDVVQSEAPGLRSLQGPCRSEVQERARGRQVGGVDLALLPASDHEGAHHALVCHELLERAVRAGGWRRHRRPLRQGNIKNMQIVFTVLPGRDAEVRLSFAI